MPFKDHVHTIAEALDTKVYFSHPYSSWECGANKNSNGLLKQYIPKDIDLRGVTEERINFAMERINYRPRKCLGFKQSAIVFKEMCLVA